MSNRPPLILSVNGVSSSPPIALGMKFWTTAKNLTAGTQAKLFDFSGNASDTATQATVGARMTATANQLNGKTTLLADGNDTYAMAAALYSIANGANTMFFISKVNTNGGTQAIVDFSEGAATDRLVSFFSTNSITYRNVTGANAGAVVTTTTTNYQMITGSFDGSITQSVAVNGGTPSTATGGAAEPGIDAAYIGSRLNSTFFITGGIAEIIMYNRALSAVEILQVELYLANEWGIYHPYAQWINSYTAMQQAIIHALKLNKDDVGTNTTSNTVAAYYDPSAQAIGATTSLTDYGRGVNTATEATNPPVNTASGIDGQNALLYNGTTTILNAGSDSSIDDIFAAGGTFICVIKPTTAGENTSATDGGRIFDKTQTKLFLQDASAGTCALRFVKNFSVTNGDWKTTARNITLGAANIVAMTYNSASVANDPVLYVNSLTAKAITETLTPTLTATSDAASSLYIGNSSASDRTFDGYIGEIFTTKQILTAGQLSTIITPLAAKYGVTLT